MASTRYHHGSLRAALLEAGLRIAAAKGPAAPAMPAVTAPTAPGTAPPASPIPRAAPVAQAQPSPAEASAQGWQVGALQALHQGVDGQGPTDGDGGPRWLLLLEQRHDGGSGDAQRLLQAMLRAAKLHQGSQVWLAPLQRTEQAGAVQGLEQALAGTEPDLVFIMGRLGAQALLETDEPLGRLRGQAHELWGLPALVSYDPVTLLRSPADKGKAWDDLCLALQLAREQYEERRASQGD
jgi:DNA polymerase